MNIYNIYIFGSDFKLSRQNLNNLDYFYTTCILKGKRDLIYKDFFK